MWRIHEQAADSYHQALVLNPGFPEARLNLAALYHENMMLEDAIAQVIKKI